MSKSELTLDIEMKAIKQFSKFGAFLCPEVSFQRPWIKDKPTNCSINEFNFDPKYTQVEGKHIRTEIVDLLESNSQKGWVCYEIKISKSDFHSKAIKSFVGHYNYYLMPKELYEQVKEEIPKEIGVYSYDGKMLNLVKKAKRQELVNGIDEQLSYGMIRSLARERDEKFEKTKDLSLRKLKEYIFELGEEITEKSDKLWKLKHSEIKPDTNEKIQELKTELDVLGDVKRTLIDIT